MRQFFATLPIDRRHWMRWRFYNWRQLSYVPKLRQSSLVHTATRRSALQDAVVDFVGAEWASPSSHCSVPALLQLTTIAKPWLQWSWVCVWITGPMNTLLLLLLHIITTIAALLCLLCCTRCCMRFSVALVCCCSLFLLGLLLIYGAAHDVACAVAITRCCCSARWLRF